MQERYKYNLAELAYQNMSHLAREPDRNRTMPVCLSPEKLKLLTEYAKKNGMTNCNQAIEYLATKNNPR